MPSETSTLMLSTPERSDCQAPRWKTELVQRATGVEKASITQSWGMPKGVGSSRPKMLVASGE